VGFPSNHCAPPFLLLVIMVGCGMPKDFEIISLRTTVLDSQNVNLHQVWIVKMEQIILIPDLICSSEN
jgi:hypothetical protein